MGKEKIAIVDDDIFIVDSLKQLLALYDYEVVCFQRGEKVFSYEDIYSISCFLIDVRMPGMSGFELLQKLLDKKAFAPIIIITGNGL